MSFEEYRKFLPKIKIPKKMFIGDGSVMVLKKDGHTYAASTISVIMHLQLLRDTLEQADNCTFLCNINVCQESIFGERVSTVDVEHITAQLLSENISYKALFRTLKHLGAPEAEKELDFTEDIDEYFDWIGIEGFVYLVRNYFKNRKPNTTWTKDALINYTGLPHGFGVDLRKHFVDDICDAIKQFDTSIKYMRQHSC